MLFGVFKTIFPQKSNFSSRVFFQRDSYHSSPSCHSPSFQKCAPFYVKAPVGVPTSFSVPVYSLKHVKIMDRITLPEKVFGVPVRKDILHRVVTWHLSCKRQGTVSKKRRGEVAGSGKKIAPQKGRGKARVGQRRSPIRRGGGLAHGPKPRNWHYILPKKIRRLGLKCALSSKFAQNKLYIIDNTELKTHKTKNFKNILQRFKWEDALIVEKQPSSFLILAHRNIPNIELIPQTKITVYDILRHKTLVLHRNTLPYIKKRVGLSIQDLNETAQPETPVPVTVRSHPPHVEAEEEGMYDHLVEEGDEEEIQKDDWEEFLRKEVKEPFL